MLAVERGRRRGAGGMVAGEGALVARTSVEVVLGATLEVCEGSGGEGTRRLEPLFSSRSSRRAERCGEEPGRGGKGALLWLHRELVQAYGAHAGAQARCARPKEGRRRRRASEKPARDPLARSRRLPRRLDSSRSQAGGSSSSRPKQSRAREALEQRRGARIREAGSPSSSSSSTTTAQNSLDIAAEPE
mgnify:CR=1 FL=1